MQVKVDQVDPSVHPVIGQYKAAIFYLLSCPLDHCLPLLPHQYSRIMSVLNQQPQSLADNQLAALVRLGLAAPLHWDDLSRWKAKDLEMSPSYVCVHLQQCSRNQFHKGQPVIVCWSDSNDTRPVAAVDSFLWAGKHKPDDPIFRRIIKAPLAGDYLTG